MSDGRVGDLVREARDQRLSLCRQQAAFAALLRRFQHMAFVTAFAATRDAEEARDVCQEAFLAAWRQLPQLREPAAFGGWLKRLVRTHCARARRMHERSQVMPDAGLALHGEVSGNPFDDIVQSDDHARIARGVAELPAARRQAVTMFYFLGASLRDIANALGIREGHAGKLVYEGRLQLRRALPRQLTEAFLAARPNRAFSVRVRAGVFDEFVGEYRFAARPTHAVLICREADMLVSYAGDQRHVLASAKADVLTPTEFDGEARFQRDRTGRISHFVYYEFGRRLGVARKRTARHGRATTRG